MGTKVCLQVVEPEEGRDSIVPATAATFPILKGRDAEHLACGACNDVLAWNVARETAREIFLSAGRLLLRCRCGAHNLVRPQPVARGTAEKALIPNEASAEPA